MTLSARALQLRPASSLDHGAARRFDGKPSLALQLKKLARRDDGDAKVFPQREEVFVSNYDQRGTSEHRAFEDHVVLGIPSDVSHGSVFRDEQTGRLISSERRVHRRNGPFHFPE